MNKSLTRRLIVAVVVSQLLLAAGLVIVSILFSRYYLQSAFDIYLEGRALSLAALVYYPDNGRPTLLFDASKIPPSTHVIHKDVFSVRSDDGAFEAHKEGYDPAIFKGIPSSAHYWDFDLDGEPYRAIILRNVAVLDTEAGIPPPVPKLTVIYAAPTMDIAQGLAGLAASMSSTTLLLLIPTLVLAIWSIRRRLMPLHELAVQARAVSVSNWEFRPSENARETTELEPLIAAIETVLEGLRGAFKRQREFIGDAAHELKTSHAILKSGLQATLNLPRTSEEYRRGLLELSEDSDRLEELLNRMLRLARVEQWAEDGIRRDLDITDLASTCEMAIARISGLASARNVRVTFSSEGTPQMRADAADLELVWINLLENAVQHSYPDSVVQISLRAADGIANVCVKDTGSGVAEADLPHIFERFRRGDPSRSRATGGFGLGLAIAKSIVEAYGGEITAQSKLGEGTQISVILPVERSSITPVASPPSSGSNHNLSLP
ncbi:MAG: hypothetical protein JWO20_2625 [Candidatus Angelobacter sp.]|nr:hypothetical protein [Candidatus Angelobacter sp.]